MKKGHTIKIIKTTACITCIKTTKVELKGNSNLIQKRLYRNLTKGKNAV